MWQRHFWVDYTLLKAVNNNVTFWIFEIKKSDYLIDIKKNKTIFY